MNPATSLLRRVRPAPLLALAAMCFLALPSPTAFAQEGGPPGPEEIQKKIREIEKLMKQAEESLARSTSSRESAEKAARRLEELLDEKAQAQTGKSAEQLRKEAREGSSASSETLKKLMEEARSEAAEASAEMERLLSGGAGSSREATEGVRKLLEETQRSGKQAGEGIEWLLKYAVSKNSKQRGSGQKPPSKPEEDPKKPGDKPEQEQPSEDKPQNPTKPPKSDREKERKVEFEQWVLKLPSQVRRAYESRNWDDVPVKWRALLRAWAEKANELEKERR